MKDEFEKWENECYIPTMKAIRSTASKAVKLAVLMLGDKAPEETIEAQARCFMQLGADGLEESLERFQDTQNLYTPIKVKSPIPEITIDKDTPFTFGPCSYPDGCSCGKNEQHEADVVDKELKQLEYTMMIWEAIDRLIKVRSYLEKHNSRHAYRLTPVIEGLEKEIE